MKEELIRVEQGCFQREDREYHFELSVSRGECIGIYVDDHLTSGTAYLDIFKGGSHLKRGKAFSCGRRVGGQALERWVLQNSMIVDKYRFESRELTVWDFLVALEKSLNRSQRKQAELRLRSSEAADAMRQMGLLLPMELSLAEVSLLDYYRLCVFRAWLWNSELLVLDRLTEVLRQKDLEKLMQCVRLLLEHGAAVILFDLDEAFMYRCCDRIDVIKDRKTYYRLYPEEYGEKLYEILGWKCRSSGVKQTGQYDGTKVILRVSGLVFPEVPPLDFQIRGGEIAFLRDENYSTAVRLRNCFLGGQRWLGGTFCLNGTEYAHGELAKLIGTYRLHAGIFLMLLVVLIMIFFWRTTLGYRINLVGQGEKVATYSGIHVKQTVVVTMCISGAFSGLAGFIETFGINYRLLDGIAGDAGNIATIVALLGSLNVYGIIAAAMFFSVLLCGGASMQRMTDVPYSVVDVIQGLIIILVIAKDTAMARLNTWFGKLFARKEKEHVE